MSLKMSENICYWDSLRFEYIFKIHQIPWRREWLLTTVFLPGEFHEQRSLVGYSPWGFKELDTTEGLIFFFNVVLYCLQYTTYSNKFAC